MKILLLYSTDSKGITHLHRTNGTKVCRCWNDGDPPSEPAILPDNANLCEMSHKHLDKELRRLKQWTATR